MTVRVISFATDVAAEDTQPDPAAVLAGTPKQRIWNYFSDASGVFHAGRWASSPGLWRVRYTESEFCYLLSGVVRLRESHGNENTFHAGSAFVIPSGFSGTWEVLEACEKLYCIYQPAAEREVRHELV